jgi:hypothetical protein
VPACLIVELTDDFSAEHPITPGEPDTIDTEEVITAVAKVVAELTSNQEASHDDLPSHFTPVWPSQHNASSLAHRSKFGRGTAEMGQSRHWRCSRLVRFPLNNRHSFGRS